MGHRIFFNRAWPAMLLVIFFLTGCTRGYGITHNFIDEPIDSIVVPYEYAFSRDLDSDRFSIIVYSEHEDYISISVLAMFVQQDGALEDLEGLLEIYDSPQLNETLYESEGTGNEWRIWYSSDVEPSRRYCLYRDSDIWVSIVFDHTDEEHPHWRQFLNHVYISR
ncbi:MAG: hypothetical protein AAGH88_03385 [Planctomycetota bacterium]